jgi:hypothetical protein
MLFTLSIISILKAQQLTHLPAGFTCRLHLQGSPAGIPCEFTNEFTNEFTCWHPLLASPAGTTWEFTNEFTNSSRTKLPTPHPQNYAFDEETEGEPVDLGSDAGDPVAIEPVAELDSDAGDPVAMDMVDETAGSAVPSVVKPEPVFDSGVFTVGETGEVGVDFLFDGGGYQGEVAIFSFEGMDELQPGSSQFIKEASSRGLSHSELGYLVISHRAEGARFSSVLGEPSQNAGEYLGVRTFAMRPGDKFGIMLVPNGRVQQVFDNPGVGGSLRPLFSLGTANPNDTFHVGQIADVTGSGSTFAIEDMRVDGWTDRDYNDIIFQVRGATGKAAHLDGAINSAKDWRGTDMGQALIAYAEPYVTPEPAEDLQVDLVDLISELEELAENPQPSDAIIEPVTEATPALEAVVAQTAESLPADIDFTDNSGTSEASPALEAVVAQAAESLPVDDLEDALADLIAELEDFTDNLDTEGDQLTSATDASPAPGGVAAEKLIRTVNNRKFYNFIMMRLTKPLNRRLYQR